MSILRGLEFVILLEVLHWDIRTSTGWLVSIFYLWGYSRRKSNQKKDVCSPDFES